jgi:aryl-alcohol dehydrogenase-like predicted oxidoreductase
MIKKELGSTGLSVSIVGYQSGHTGSHQVSEENAEFLLNTALDNGISLINASPYYGDSLERTGRFLAGRRSEVVLSVNLILKDDGPASPSENLIAGLNRTLKSLNTDTIDLLMIQGGHRTDPINRCLEMLYHEKNRGKFRFLGYAGKPDTDLQIEEFDVYEVTFNICDQSSLDPPVKWTRERKRGVIAKRALANAFWENPHSSDPVTREYRKRAAVMDLKPGDLTWNQLALRFAAYTPGIDSVLIGTRNTEHLLRNIDAVNQGPLSGQFYRELRNLFKLFNNGWLSIE